MNQQAVTRPQIRRTVAHDLPQRTVQTDKPDQAATTSGIPVRTDLKGGLPLLLAAGLLGNGAAAGGGAIPS